MAVAVLAGLPGYVFQQLAVYLGLVDGFVVLGVMALEATVVGNEAPIAGLFVGVQNNGLCRDLDGFVRIALKVRYGLLDGRFVHGHPAGKPRIVMAAGTIVVVLGRAGFLPFSNGLPHFMADDTGDILKVPNRNLMKAQQKSERHRNQQDPKGFPAFQNLPLLQSEQQRVE